MPKNTGKKLKAQGNHRENTGNFALIEVWPPCCISPCEENKIFSLYFAWLKIRDPKFRDMKSFRKVFAHQEKC